MGLSRSAIIDKDLTSFLDGNIINMIEGIDVRQEDLIDKKSEIFTQKFLKDSKGILVKNAPVHNLMHRFLRYAQSKGYNKFLCLGSMGHGKSMISGTYILMYDCTLKKVEDIVINDILMGPDSRPRKVLFLGNGKERAYKITLSNGDSFECNESHKLSLKVSRNFWGFKKGEILDDVLLTDYIELPNWIKINCLKMYKVPLELNYQETPDDPYSYGQKIGNFRVQHREKDTQFYRIWAGIIQRCDNPSVFGYNSYGGRGITYDPNWKYYLNFKKDMYWNYIYNKKKFKLKQPSIERINVNGHYCKENCCFIEVNDQGKNKRFSEHNKNILDVDLNYFNNTINEQDYYNNFDRIYLINDRETRLQVLAGFLDIHGTKPTKKFKMYRVKIKENDKFRDDILFLCRSLGFSVSWVKTKASKNAFSYHITISGNIDQIPCRINTINFKFNKQRNINHLEYSFKIEPIGIKEYFGFGVDKDHLFLHHDLTVLRNTEQLCTGWVMHQVAKNPNLLCKIVHVSETESVKRCRAIRDYITKDEDLHRIAPHLLPTPIWGSQRFIVKRSAMSKDGTVEAYGVLSTAIGGRANLLVFDDPQDLKTAVLEPSTRQKIEDVFKNIWLTRLIPQDSQVLVMMNKWSTGDLAAIIQRNPVWAWMSIAVADSLDHLIYEDSFGRKKIIPTWSKFNKNDLLMKLKEIGQRDFDRGYRLIPYTDSDKSFPSFRKCCHFGVKPEQIIDDEKNWIFIGGIDFAGLKRPGTVISVIAVHKKTGMKVPVAVQLLRGTQDVPFYLLKFFRKFGVDVFIAENNGVQDAIIDMLISMMGQDKYKKYGIKIEGFQTGKNKADPINGLPSMEKEFDNQEWMFCFEKEPQLGDEDANDPWLRLFYEFSGHPFHETTDVVMSLWFCREGSKQFLRGSEGPHVW